MNIFQKIVSFLLSPLIAVGLVGTPAFKVVNVQPNANPDVQTKSFGASNFNPAQLQPFSLAGGGVAIGATTITLTSFNDINGTQLTMSVFGSKGYMTIEPSNKSREEQISFTGVSGNTLTGVKSVSFTYPYTETSGVSKSHPGGSVVVASNTSGFYSQFAILGNTSTWTGIQTFASSAIPQLASDTTNAQVSASPYNLVNYSTLASTSFAGSVPANTSPVAQ